MPDTQIHDRLTTVKMHVTYHWVPCSCGWVSDKWGDEEDAIRQHADHAEHCDNVIPLFR